MKRNHTKREREEMNRRLGLYYAFRKSACLLSCLELVNSVEGVTWNKRKEI